MVRLGSFVRRAGDKRAQYFLRIQRKSSKSYSPKANANPLKYNVEI